MQNQMKQSQQNPYENDSRCVVQLNQQSFF